MPIPASTLSVRAQLTHDGSSVEIFACRPSDASRVDDYPIIRMATKGLPMSQILKVAVDYQEEHGTNGTVDIDNDLLAYYSHSGVREYADYIRSRR